MKELDQLVLPETHRYAKSHEWASRENDLIVVGINDYAQDQLGDVVFVELPELGATFTQDSEFGSVESVKAVSELYLPIGGTIAEINDDLADNPALVNESPYDDGWLVKVRPDNMDDLDLLMDKKTYIAALTGE